MVVLKNTAHVLTYLDKVPRSADCQNQGAPLSRSSPNMQLAEKYYLRSIEADPENAQSLMMYANFLAELGRIMPNPGGDDSEADVYRQRSLKAKP